MHAVAAWSSRRWLAAVAGALGTALLIGLPTDLIPNPVFGRQIEAEWWSLPVLVVTSVLGGLLLATYVRNEPLDLAGGPAAAALDDELDRPAKTGGIGGLVSFFAVGCPTCNKVVVLALGTTGALDWFAPAQPILAVVSIGLLAWALRSRLRGEVACRIAT